MLKNLLYLYNDGHNPFPNMRGYGGLGYHLPQYHKVIHGGTLTPENKKIKELLEEIDVNTEGGGGGGRTNEEIQKELYKILDNQNTELIDLEEKELKEKLNTGNTGNKIKDLINDIESDTKVNEIKSGITKSDTSEIMQIIDKAEKLLPKKSNKAEDISNKVEDKSDEVKITPDKAKKSVEKNIDKVDKVITDDKTPQIKEKKKTNTEIKAEQNATKFAITEKLFEKGFKKNADNKKVANSILEILPQLSKEEFNNDPEKYLNMHYNKKFEQIDKMESIKKAVSEEHGKGDTDTRGHAAEIILLRDYQNDIKELTNSTDPDDIISLSSESDGFKNDDGVIPLSWTGKPISHYSLFDADGKNSSIDLKYYDSENVDIQFSKIDGNVDNIPLYREIDGKIKLYNVVNKTTKKLINKHNDTDTYIVAKTPSTLASWQLNKFIQENINKETEVKKKKYNNIDCFIIEPSFMERMIKEGKVNKGNTHKEYGWFTVNTKNMIKK